MRNQLIVRVKGEIQRVLADWDLKPEYVLKTCGFVRNMKKKFYPPCTKTGVILPIENRVSIKITSINISAGINNQ